MKYRKRIYYTEADKSLMWDRWRKGDSLHAIARLFDRPHSSVRGILERSGYYDWLKKPESDRAVEDKRLLRLIRASFTASQGVYGAPRVFLDLREAGETCSKHRVAQLMRENDIRAKPGYRTRRDVDQGTVTRLRLEIKFLATHNPIVRYFRQLEYSS